MRRWLTIVLLLVLPLQFSWSAAAAYCQHEAAASTSHLGHHTHEHKAEKKSDDGVSGKLQGKSFGSAVKLSGDNDCGYCHLSVAKPLAALALQFSTDAHFPLDIEPEQDFQSRGPDHRERPNWRIA